MSESAGASSPEVQAAATAGKASHAAPEVGWMTSGSGHPRRWPILAVLVVSLLVVVLDNTVLNIALPTIQEDLSATPSQLLWSVDSYILAFAALLFTWGVIGDRVGRKRVLMLGLFVFGVASAACAFAANPGQLIGFRTVMGIGGAAVLPTTLAIITVVFPPHERGKAIGLWAGAVGAAVALGPVLGGILLENPAWSSWLTGNDWGSVFLINVPIVVVGLFFIWRIVPETRNPHPQKLDLPGLVLSAVGLTLVVYGIIHASSTRNWLDRGVVVPMVLGMVILIAFVMYEKRISQPSFDVTLFANRGYGVSLVAVSLSFFAMSGITFSLPFYLQILRGFSTLTAGLCFLPFAIGQLLAAPRSASMVARFGYKPVMTVGLTIVGLSLLGLSRIGIETPVWIVLVVFFFFGLGMGNVIAPASTVMQNVLPLARAGAGSAVQNTVRQVFGALGVAVIGTILATQYATGVSGALDQLPAQVPDEVKAQAGESIVATEAVLNAVEAKGLPSAVVEPIRQTAYEAFLTASHHTTLLSAIVVFIAAIVVFTMLPHIEQPRAGQRPVVPADNKAEELIETEVEEYADQAAEEYVPDRRHGADSADSGEPGATEGEPSEAKPT